MPCAQSSAQWSVGRAIGELHHPHILPKYLEIKFNREPTLCRPVAGVGNYLNGIGAMVETEEYRRRARRCLIMAQGLSDPRERAKLLDLACKWMLFAERVQKPMMKQQQTQPKRETKD